MSNEYRDSGKDHALGADRSPVTELDAVESGRQPAEPPESEDSVSDPFLAALAAAELDDEPFTDEERASAQAGWAAYLRGESTPWEDVRHALLDEADAAKISTS
ncbi:MAG: hypothetical protein H0V00_03185 [Chloroflexia bacterium]|nr:hypothetical protein [Chloroflexia bacterium]